MEKRREEKRARRPYAPREVRMPESVFLSRPDLWSREGMEEYLREHGIDPSQPYQREETFVQLDTAA